MKILLLTPQNKKLNNVQYGGISKWTDNFLRNIDLEKHVISIVNTATIGNRENAWNSRMNFFTEIHRFIMIIFSLMIKLISQEYDVIHINSSCSKFGIFRDYLCLKLSLFSKAQVITHFHCNLENQVKSNKLVFYFLQKIVEQSSKILVLNNRSMEYVDLHFGVKCEKIPNFLDTKYIKTEIKKIKPQVEVIVFVGSILKAKGCKEIFEVANHFKNIKFNLIGVLNKEAESWDIPENLLLLGGLNEEDVFYQLDNADVFLFPTHSEGFSLALLEAMARGLPIITTDVGANSEMLENRGGLFVGIGDVGSIISSINLIQDKDLRQRMSIWNVEKVYNFYSSKKVIDSLFSIYNQLINKKQIQ